MAKLHDLIAAAEEAVEERLADSVYEPSDPASFPKRPSTATEALRKKIRTQADTDLYFFTSFVLGYDKLRPEPHGELCAFLDFLDGKRAEGVFDFNRTITYMPRDLYKTTIQTIARNVRRAAKNPEVRILIVADTSDNASRFMIEVGNHFKYNELLQWLYPEVIPDNFGAVRWNTKEIVLKRKSPWREPTFDAMGAGAGIESRHYDHICPDDLVTEKHIHSDTEMDKLISWLPGLEPLLVNDVESTIEFVGSRKKKGDAYEFVEKYFGVSDSLPRKIGPHAIKQGTLCVYSRSIIEDGKVIFPYVKEKKSGVSMEYINRVRTYDPERYWAQLANSPKGTGLNWFNVSDLRRFKINKSGMIEAVHDGKLVERVSVWALERIVLYDPAVSERKSSSKQALWVVAKGSGPNRYLLGGYYGHILPDEMIDLLYRINARWRPEFFSIEKRGFQGWVKYSLDVISELKGLDFLPIMPFPPEGSERARWAKAEHIRSLQPVFSSHLFWVPETPDEDYRPAVNQLIEDIEFYPNIRFEDGLDALAQGVEWWPFSIDEAELAAAKQRESNYLQTALPDRFRGFLPESNRKTIWDEQKFLASLDATGYSVRRETFNN
jgi:hypothetical protein